eukprot:scaffold38589_cov40-Attheya_sp.AAC.4
MKKYKSTRQRGYLVHTFIARLFALMMNKAIFASAMGLVALIEPGTAFAPVSNTNARVNTELAATSDRRELLGNLAKALGGVAAAAGAAQQFS